MSIEMNKKTDSRGRNAVWNKIIHLPPGQHDDRISWRDLLGYASRAYNSLVADRTTYWTSITDNDTRLVAALFVPSSSGGRIFLSTIPRGEISDEMCRHAKGEAKIWWQAAFQGRDPWPHHLCAEDGAIWLFEHDYFEIDNYVDPGASHFNNPNIRIACWGLYGSEFRQTPQPPPGPKPLCSTGKTPSTCRNTAQALHIEYWTQAGQTEEERRPPPASGQGPSGGGPGGTGPGGAGSGGAGPGSYYGQSNTGYGQSSTGYGQSSNPAGGQSSSTNYPPTNQASYSVNQLTAGLANARISDASSQIWMGDDGYYQKYSNTGVKLFLVKGTWCERVDPYHKKFRAWKPPAISTSTASPSNTPTVYRTASPTIRTASPSGATSSSSGWRQWYEGKSCYGQHGYDGPVYISDKGSWVVDHYPSSYTTQPPAPTVRTASPTIRTASPSGSTSSSSGYRQWVGEGNYYYCQHEQNGPVYKHINGNWELDHYPSYTTQPPAPTIRTASPSNNTPRVYGTAPPSDPPRSNDPSNSHKPSKHSKGKREKVTTIKYVGGRKIVTERYV